MDVTPAIPSAASRPAPVDGGRHAAPAPAAPSVELHVESLVLAGFRPEDRHRIGAALQGELARLLAERGVPPGLDGGVDAAVLRAAAVDLPRDAHPAAVGARLARSVYGALGGAGGR
jgi:hypothetical protein